MRKRKYLLEEIRRNELISKKHKKTYKNLTCVEYFLILTVAITECVSISVFILLVGIPIGDTSSAVGLKICATTVGIKRYKSISKKKRKKYDKTVFLGKTKLNDIEVLIFKTLIHLYINHDEFVSIKNVLKNIMRLKKK